MLCKRSNVNCIVHTGAAGSLGKFLVKLCKKEGINLINIVRRQSNVELLKSIGSEYILDCSTETFGKDMRTMFKKLKPMFFFDCVSGDLGTKIFSAMPAKSTTYVYGALDLKPYDIPAGELLFTDKSLKGFWMSTFLQENPKLVPKLNEEVLKNLNAGDYKITISKRFTPEEFEQAVEYYQENQSKGKVLLQTQAKPKL